MAHLLITKRFPCFRTELLPTVVNWRACRICGVVGAVEDSRRSRVRSRVKRLARTLLLLARYGEEAAPPRVLPKLSQVLHE